MKKLKGCAGVFLIFFLGFLLGAGLTSFGIYAKARELITDGPEKVTAFVVEKFDHDLHLDDVQEREMQRIADETRLRLRAIQHRTRPDVDAVLDDAAGKVRAILTPEQVKKFDDLIGHWREKWIPIEPPATTPAPATPAPPQ